ncbi:MAG: N-acyl homoserine lactonase family protein [Desulforhopalus sp.]
MTFSITPLLTGVRNPDQGIMTYQKGYGKSIWLPIWAFLLQDDEYTILVDTGLDENELYVPARFTEETGLKPASIVDCLAIANLTVDDIDIVINTHLHDDHCGNNGLFQKAQFFTHKNEIDFCNSPHPLDHRYDNFFIEGTTFSFVEDGQEIVPGVTVIFSPGHTLGCLSVRVETGIGAAVITGFCCNRENFPENGPAVCPGVHLDAVAAWESIQKIKELGVVVLPMHDLGLKRIEG